MDSLGGHPARRAGEIFAIFYISQELKSYWKTTFSGPDFKKNRLRRTNLVIRMTGYLLINKAWT